MSFTNIDAEKRVRVCFNCREFHRIDVNDYNIQESLHNFEKKHQGHRTQVVDMKVLAEILPYSQQTPKVW